MATVYDGIDERMATWLAAQAMFVVGTAPLSGDGHVNVSPKGMAGTFAVLGPHHVAYLDYSGSGAETIAHLRENGRIVLMFCSFDTRPSIVRLHGHGTVHQVGTPRFAALRPAFSKARTIGQRSIIEVEVTRVADACGYAVPMGDLVERDVLDTAQERRDESYFPDYWRRKNLTSVDGLPAVEV